MQSVVWSKVHSKAGGIACMQRIHTKHTLYPWQKPVSVCDWRLVSPLSCLGASISLCSAPPPPRTKRTVRTFWSTSDSCQNIISWTGVWGLPGCICNASAGGLYAHFFCVGSFRLQGAFFACIYSRGLGMCLFAWCWRAGCSSWLQKMAVHSCVFLCQKRKPSTNTERWFFFLKLLAPFGLHLLPKNKRESEERKCYFLYIATLTGGKVFIYFHLITFNLLTDGSVF